MSHEDLVESQLNRLTVVQPLGSSLYLSGSAHGCSARIVPWYLRRSNIRRNVPDAPAERKREERTNE